jgi:hypothetical protein
MTFKNSLSISTVFLALALLAFPYPGQATQIYFLDVAHTGGDITTASFGSPVAVTGLTNVPFDEMIISGDTAVPGDNGTYTGFFLGGGVNGESLSSNGLTLTLQGTLNGCSLCTTNFGSAFNTASVLATITFSSTPALTANANSSGITVNTPSASNIASIALSPTLLADLGLTGTPFFLTQLTDVGQSVGGVANYVVINSASLDFSSSVPEPASGSIAILGVALIAFMSRKRFSRAG